VKELYLALANLFLLATVSLYFWNLIKKGVTPNPTTFFVRSVVGVMNFVSYLAVVHKDYLKISSLVLSTLGMLLIFFYALAKKRTTELRRADVICGSAALVIGVIWKTTENDLLANLLLQAVMLFAFYPAIEGVWKGIAKEKALPWVCAVISYGFMTCAVAGNGWEALVHPVISGIFGNGILAVAIIIKNKKGA
jgi:hypothetical protein